MGDLGYPLKEIKLNLFIRDFAEKEIRVVGNFMGWSENNPIWKMRHNPENDNWKCR
jgi:hypothetical protein